MKFAVAFALVFCLAAPSWADQGRGKSKKGDDRSRSERSERGKDHDKDRGRGGADSYFERHGYSRLHIPKGHYPPPGECRIWYPDRPPGHQPAPGKCDRLRAQVPPGAWLIRHPADDAEHVDVVVYDERRPGSILVVGQFKIASGIFVRVVVDR